jgi:catechol 2,3-dioxygenase-like lactoylglutathione lyase family enzyme
MTISLSTVHIYVDDPDAALAFYREIQIVLSQPAAGRSQEDGDALAALLAKGELPGPFFRSDDLDAIFEQVAAAPGVEVLEEPADRFWGARDFAVRDPAGNMLRIKEARDG